MVKMSDVAEKANVSKATVSRVLRNPEAVKKDTRDKVLAIIEQMNYQPNILARHFRRSQTNTILVVVPNIMNTVFSHILGGIEHAAGENGYRVLLANTNKQVEREYEYLDHLKQRQVDGMILLSARMDKNVLTEVMKQFPVVLTADYLEGVAIPTVTIDNVSSARTATEHLINMGHSRIAHITGPLHLLVSQDRLKGYRQALLQNGLAFDNILIQEGDFSHESGYNQMTKLMALEKPPTAVFSANDEMATGVIKAAKENGLSVPGDLAVVGFDNIKLSAIYDPGITTIAQPTFEMGKKAMELLLEQINGIEMGKRQHVLENELIIRESCGANFKKNG
ncbi:LacI family DNA-binding transcriptional regulator [Fictibacillus terranigra]|uniref:LacI family DNA-binding transcriptional regulator n=1 Tax=Fictibacillus terranigra TaxID=3058424 RepID=A0ABT8E1J9_9BACL|nr:LacI family DNA-binding transcriptional regulator [Fictibacillus sp. CENA-BCM004]MDN4071795.1 LacI family DNA-binding transcriptional regulator [Fictibacillus sp. CENA-BCM004]